MSRFANLLKSLGVRKGDRVAIYMPMVPQAAYAMLACARIGAVHKCVSIPLVCCPLRCPCRLPYTSSDDISSHYLPH